MRDSTLKDKRNKAIVKRFNQLTDIKTPGGRQKYSYDCIYEKLTNQFFLKEFTIALIINDHYRKNKKQK